LSRSARCGTRRQFLRAALATTALASFAAGCQRGGDQLRLKIGHSLDPSHTVHKAMLYMGERLEEHSGGSMAVDVYPSSQLGQERELIELLQIGSLAMTKVSASPLESFVPEMKVFNIPYLFRDEKHFWDVLDSGIGRELLLKPETVRLRGLGYYDAGSRSFYTVDHLVRTPADLKGLKIRVQQSQTAIRMVKAFGGAPTPISWGELYTALQQGVVDGAENNPPSFYLSGHYEVAKYYTLDEHTYVPDILLISKYVWDHLLQEQRDWLQLSVDESVIYQKALWKKDVQHALDAVTAAGVTVYRPDKALFARKVEGMYRDYEGTDIGELIRRIRVVN
jgi:tripartite ATP-independent transporter DctP family solute receptor